MFDVKEELQYAKNRFEYAEFLFNNCDEDMVEYANAELNAAFEYLNYVFKKQRNTQLCTKTIVTRA